jgi:hypothetical protein
MKKSAELEGSVAVPAWYDPKSRKLVYDLTTLRVGILTASEEAITFVLPPDEVLFASALDDVKFKWSPWNLSMTATVGSQAYRIYFNPPKSSMSWGSAPSLPGKEKSELGELFVTSTKIAEISGTHGDTFDALKSLSEGIEVAALLGQAFAMYGGIISYRKAHKVLA